MVLLPYSYKGRAETFTSAVFQLLMNMAYYFPLSLRLWEMLDKYGQEKQLFRTYENLASQGSRLCQELRMLQEQLGTQFSQLPKLVSENEVLHSMMYGDSNQLMLHAQVCKEP